MVDREHFAGADGRTEPGTPPGLWRAAARSRLSRRLRLAGRAPRAARPTLLFLPAAVAAWVALALHTGPPGLSELLGVAAGLGMGASGVAVVWGRARHRAQRLRPDRRALRDVLLAASAEDPMAELARISRTLDCGGLLTGMRIWRLSRDGQVLELLGHRVDPAGSPPPIASLPRRHPLIEEVFSRGEPVLVDGDRDLRVASGIPALGIGAGYAAPAVLGGREFGVVGARLADPRDAGDSVRDFVRDLADAVAAALAAAAAREDRHPLDAERRRFRATIEAMPVGVLLTDPAGKIVHLNERLTRLLGLGGASPWLGRPASEMMERIVPRLDEGVRDEVVRGTLELATDRSRELLRFDFRLRADGREEEKALVLTARPMPGEDGRLGGRVWVLGDVTEDRKLAERLERTHRMETLATLAGGLAHDLGNHLTAVLATADTLADHAGDPGRVRFAAERIRAAARHCADLNRGLLRFARQESARVEPVPVAEAIAEVAGLVRATAPPSVCIEVEVDPAAGFVAADAGQLHRALTNLAVNAVDAVGDSGQVRISARRAAASGEGDFVEITVADDGAGMSEETARRAFDPFFTTKPVGEGTGLGLAVTYGIVDAHGGRIEADSAPGRGTRMRLLWPAAPGGTASEPAAAGEGVGTGKGRAAPVPSRPASAARSGSARTVLLVEDDAEIRDLMAQILASAGFTVIEAGGVADALERFEAASSVAAVVADRLLPDGDGCDLVAELQRRIPGLPALLVTGAGEEPDGPGAGFLAKPFTARELLDRLRERLAA